MAEHSLIHKFGAERPDAQDIEELNAFASQIINHIKSEPDNALVLSGNRPYKVYNGIPAKPLVSEDCCGCAICAWNCPVEAISEAEPNVTDNEKCISCMRCISVCPNQARYLAPEILEAFTQKLSAVASERRKNILYL